MLNIVYSIWHFKINSRYSLLLKTLNYILGKATKTLKDNHRRTYINSHYPYTVREVRLFPMVQN